MICFLCLVRYTNQNLAYGNFCGELLEESLNIKMFKSKVKANRIVITRARAIAFWEVKSQN